jgi:hypothetical protein
MIISLHVACTLVCPLHAQLILCLPTCVQLCMDVCKFNACTVYTVQCEKTVQSPCLYVCLSSCQGAYPCICHLSSVYMLLKIFLACLTKNTFHFPCLYAVCLVCFFVLQKQQLY